MCLYFYYTSLSSAKHCEVSWGEKSSSAFEIPQKEMLLIITSVISEPVLVTGVLLMTFPMNLILFISCKMFFSFRSNVALLFSLLLHYYLSPHQMLQGREFEVKYKCRGECILRDISWRYSRNAPWGQQRLDLFPALFTTCWAFSITA